MKKHNDLFEIQEPDANLLICQSCGGKINKVDKYCLHCGARFS